jgi:hypothetical protein
MENNQKTATQGRPWTVIATFSDFESAHALSERSKQERGMQSKVKRLASGFTVRTRRDETKQTSKTESLPTIAERPTFEEPVSKKTKLKAKDRRAKERRPDSDEDES